MPTLFGLPVSARWPDPSEELAGLREFRADYDRLMSTEGQSHGEAIAALSGLVASVRQRPAPDDVDRRCAELREALEAERVARTGVELELAVQTGRAAGPHIPPALLRRIEALGFVPGSGEPVGWLVAELERLKADHTALLLGVGHPMWLPSVADAVDHPDQFNATPDEVLHRVRAVVAERDELAATLANERGEGAPPSEGWIRNDFDPKDVGIAWYASAHADGRSATTDDVDHTYVLWVYREPTECAWRWELDDETPKGVDVYLANGTAPTARAAMRAASDALAARSAGGGGS